MTGPRLRLRYFADNSFYQCFVTPLKKLRLSPAFATQKGDGGKDDRRPVKVIGDDAHEEEPAAREVSCCMVYCESCSAPPSSRGP